MTRTTEWLLIQNKNEKHVEIQISSRRNVYEKAEKQYYGVCVLCNWNA